MFGNQKSIEELIKEMDPREIALGLRRTEADIAGKNLYLYRKGAKSMLQNFVDDNYFVDQVMDYFDWYYRKEDMDPDVQRVFADHKLAFEKWPHGEPIDHWYDDNGNLCVRYRNGEWWHYKGFEENQEITWW